MLQIHFIRQHTDLIIQQLAKRNIDALHTKKLLTTLLTADEKMRKTQQQIDGYKSQINTLSKDIGELIKRGEKKSTEEKKAVVVTLKKKIQTEEQHVLSLQKEVHDSMIQLPNLPHDKVPAGSGPSHNVIISTHGEPSTMDKEALPHWELIKKYDLVNFDIGVKITGAGFPLYQGKGAQLQRALIHFFLDEANKAGYVEVQPPIVVNRDSAYATGNLPDKEGQMYHVSLDELYLIPTAEIPITNIYRNDIIEVNRLPLKHVGYTPCFRREAGSWGAHVRGLNRLHQFDKVEIVQICLPEDSYSILDDMCTHVHRLLEKLELPYRKVLLCGGDMGPNASMTYDFEVWSAAQQRWLEVSSVSNFEIFQANRLKLRYKKEGKTNLLHTLNGSALALPRILAALLENNQTQSSIRIPSALVTYTGFDHITA